MYFENVGFGAYIKNDLKQQLIESIIKYDNIKTLQKLKKYLQKISDYYKIKINKLNIIQTEKETYLFFKSKRKQTSIS